MQIKLYKVMGVTPSDAHWFLQATEHSEGVGSGSTEFKLYSKELITQSSTYDTERDAQQAIERFNNHHAVTHYAYNTQRCMRVRYDRLTLSVVEFTAEV